MKVIIFTEGGRNIGFGHLTRCISLYEGFTQKGIQVQLIVNGDRTTLDLLKGKDYQLFNWLKERKKLFKIIANAEIIIIDSYLADVSFYKKFSGLIKIPVYIDDTKRLNYPSGIVINGSIFAQDIDYPKSDSITYLLGIKYIPLRREFWQVHPKRINKNINSIMITFGGEDRRGLTPKITNLVKREYPRLIKNIIIGRGFKNIKEIERLKDEKTRLIYYPDANTMRKVMLQSDIAISAGGQTLYELARIGVPTIALVVSQNQLNNIRGWQKAGFIEYAGWWKDEGAYSRLSKAFRVIASYDERFKRKKIGIELVDGKGTERIANMLLKKYEN